MKELVAVEAPLSLSLSLSGLGRVVGSYERPGNLVLVFPGPHRPVKRFFCVSVFV